MELISLLERFQHILVVDFFRYFIPAGLAFFLFWVVFRKHFSNRLIYQHQPRWKSQWFELKYSLMTIVIFACVGLMISIAYELGWLQIYTKIEHMGWGYFLLSLAIMVVFHDFYFYWTHRWMHQPRIFKYVHRVHHLSLNPSPWAAYAFHPLEALLQAFVLPLIVFFLPVHGLAIGLFLIYMIARNVWGHLGYELLPHQFIQSRWFNWHTTTTHHALHHKHFNSNYGLYFTWWDRWMDTTQPDYQNEFEKITRPTSIIKNIKVLMIVMLAVFSSPGFGQSPLGQWVTFNESTGLPLSIVRIDKDTRNQTFFGKIDSVIVPSYQGESGRCVLCEGDKKDQPLIGLEFLWDFDWDGSAWVNGKILDPESGIVYESKIWFGNQDSIYVRGYGGPFNLFYRTQIWQRKTGSGIQGVWRTIDDRFDQIKAEVMLEVIDGKLSGKLLKIFLMPNEGNYPLCTTCDGDLKNIPIVGMQFMDQFIRVNGSWNHGTILDPGSGRAYSGKFWLKDANTLVVRGYWGPFFRTQVWKRLAGP